MKKYLGWFYHAALLAVVASVSFRTFRTFRTPIPTIITRSTTGRYEQGILNQTFDTTTKSFSVNAVSRGVRAIPAYPLEIPQMLNLAFDDTTDSLNVNLNSPIIWGNGLYLFGNKTTLSDDSSVGFPIGAGRAWVMCGDAAEYGEVAYTTTGTVTSLQATANFAVADTDSKCAVFGNASTVIVKNRLGSQQIVTYYGVYR